MPQRAAPNRIYWPKCSVCQYMKKNQDFRRRILASTYFLENSHETPMMVNQSFGSPFKSSTLYQHLKRHQDKDKVRLRALAPIAPTLPAMTGAVEGIVVADKPHEQYLDKFIEEGHQKVLLGEMQITASTYLTAIKTKAEIEKSTKDRRMEMIKAFFGGGSGPEASSPSGQTPAS